MCFKSSLILFKCVIVITLLVVYYQYFFKDVMVNYQKGLTNMATTETEFEADETGIKMPSLVFCMAPTMKQKVLDKYNISSEFFMMQNGDSEHLIVEKSMEEIILESSFRLNEDFQIAINCPYCTPKRDDNLKLTIGTNTLQLNGKEISFNITEVYSIQQGLCNILSSDLIIPATGFILSMILNEDNPNQLMNLNIVSDTDALGILMGLWRTKPLVIQGIMFNTTTTLIDLQETMKTKIKNCDLNDSPYYKCLTKNVELAIQASNCSKKCKPMLVKSYFDTYFTNDGAIPDCSDLKEEKCIFDVLTAKFSSILPLCKEQCQNLEYSGQITETVQVMTNFPHDIGQRVDLSLQSTSLYRTIIEEYKIYDEVALIGSIGGSLGLFLGFSFYGVLSDVLDHFWKKITKQD